MSRTRTCESISGVLSSAENLRNAIDSLPDQIRDKTRDLALAIVTTVPKKRGRPPGKRSKRRGRPPKRTREAKPP